MTFSVLILTGNKNESKTGRKKDGETITLGILVFFKHVDQVYAKQCLLLDFPYENKYFLKKGEKWDYIFPSQYVLAILNIVCSLGEGV